MDGKLKITASTILGILLPDQKALRKPELSGPAHDAPLHGIKWRVPEPAQLQRRSLEAAMIMHVNKQNVCKYSFVPYTYVYVHVMYKNQDIYIYVPVIFERDVDGYIPPFTTESDTHMHPLCACKELGGEGRAFSDDPVIDNGFAHTIWSLDTYCPPLVHVGSTPSWVHVEFELGYSLVEPLLQDSARVLVRHG